MVAHGWTYDPGMPPRRQTAGAWFGTQFGASAWLLGGVALLPTAPSVAIAFLGMFAAVNAIGFELWRRRARLGSRRALIATIATIGAAGLVV